MKKLLFGTALLIAGALAGAYADPAGDVTSAAQKLAAGTNYSWRTTVTVPEGSRFRPGPIDGKVDGNLTDIKLSMRDNHTEIIMNGTNTAVTDPDDGTWEKLSDVDTQGAGRFLTYMVQNFKAPPAQAIDLVSDAQSLQQSGNSYSGALTEEGAKNLLTFRRGGNAQITNSSGTVTFSVDDGVLAKYEYHVKGSIKFGGEEHPIDRDTTVEIKDVGKTTIDVPDDAKKLIL